MNIVLRPAAGESALPALLTAYYREGEDANTSPTEMMDFISYLEELLEADLLQGVVAFDGDLPLGFVLYAVDDADFPFSQRPGTGTIAEIGVVPELRRMHMGRMLVRYAEDALRTRVQEMYVCAYPAAQAFWQQCGYLPTGNLAENGLPLCVKHLDPHQ